MKNKLKYLIGALALLAAGVVGWRFLAAGDSRASEGRDAGDTAPIVAAARAERSDLIRTIKLTAEFRPYQDIDIHAKVAGFVESIPVDIGDRVKQGGVIATLEIPELKEDLTKAQAGVDAANEAVKQSDADYQGVHLDYSRLQQVAKEHPKLVAQQELDDARAKDEAAAAGLANARQRVGEAQAEMQRDSTLVDYSKITAPFDGVVTKRYADVGALIQAGTSSSVQGTALVHFAQENVLRVMFPVPESAVKAVADGVPVRIDVSGLDRSVDGKVTRFARQLDPATRTMETEVDIPNGDLSITPGMYGWATLTLEEHRNTLSVPVEAVASGENPSVYLIDRNNKIEDRPVRIGMQTPDRIEIIGGLNVGDLVFIGNRSQVHVGGEVKPKVVGADETAYKEGNG